MNSHSLVATSAVARWGAWAPVATVVLTVLVAAGGLAWSLGGNFARLEAAIERVQVSVDRNREAIDRNREAIEANRAAISENSATMAGIAGQLAEHLRHHDREAEG